MKRYMFISLMILALFVSCTHDRNDPGLAYFPDMAYSNAYEAYTVNPVFDNGQSMQTPIEGTVPREMIPYQYDAGYEGQLLAGVELANPLEINKNILAEGKEQFEIYCMMCHGEKGKGDGHLFTSKLFPAKPTDLSSENIQNKPDGEIYHIITHGSLSKLMGAHGSQINPENRWKIIAYIKNELK